MTPYRRSLGGRLMLLSMGLFFLSFGIGTIISDPDTALKAFVLLVMIASTVIIFAVPISFSTDAYIAKTVFWLCVFPFLVWLVGPMIWDSIGVHGIVEKFLFGMGVVGLAMASDPRSSGEADAEA